MITIPLKKMTVAEKIQAMESIWEDLCSHAGSLSSPTWHEDVLADREEMQQRGEDPFEDWETAKKRHSREGGNPQGCVMNKKVESCLKNNADGLVKSRHSRENGNDAGLVSVDKRETEQAKPPKPPELK